MINNGVGSCQQCLPSSTAHFAKPAWRRCASNTSRWSAKGASDAISTKQREFQMRNTILIAAIAILDKRLRRSVSRP